jgi:hypothetical protein
MAQLFHPKVPAPVVVNQDVPAAPTVDVAAAQLDTADRLRKRKGSASTILVKDPLGAPPQQLGA